jgi:hypothetical protein
MNSVEQIAPLSGLPREAADVASTPTQGDARTPSLRVLPHFRQARLQAALVRALLDEFEAALPPSVAEAPFDPACGRQVSDELAALADRIGDCVAAMTEAKGGQLHLIVRGARSGPSGPHPTEATSAVKPRPTLAFGG